MFLQVIKNSSIILSYAWLLIAICFLDWEPILFFLSIFLELIALLVVYVIIRFKHQLQQPDRYRKQQPLVNVLIGSIPLIIFHLAIIAILAPNFNSDLVFSGRHSFLLSPTFFWLLATNIIIYLIHAIQIKQSEIRITLFQQNLLFKALLLTVINLIGVLVFGENSTYLPVLIALTLLRLFIEWRFSKRIQLI